MHLRGPSWEGKTTAALVAATVWGEPGRMESWRATGNGLEGVAALHNDNLLLLDELKEIDPNEAGAVAYMLANGSGKRRGRPHGGTRPRLTWKVLFLSTGEISLAQHVEAAGQRVHAGQEVRLIDLPADAGQGHGLFEALHGYANGQMFADGIKERVQETHGTAGRAFVELLVRDMPRALEQVRELIHGFLEHSAHNGDWTGPPRSEQVCTDWGSRRTGDRGRDHRLGGGRRARGGGAVLSGLATATWHPDECR